MSCWSRQAQASVLGVGGGVPDPRSCQVSVLSNSTVLLAGFESNKRREH